MIYLLATLLLAASGPKAPPFTPPHGSTVEFTTTLPDSDEDNDRAIVLPNGCEVIRGTRVSYPCPDYKSEVIKEGFIMSTGQVAHLFGALSKEHAFSFHPDDSAHYLVIRVKNTGCLPARGVISCELSPDYLPFKVQIPYLRPYMETFAHYVIPLQPFSSTPEAVKEHDRFVHLDWEILSIILDLE